jgi:hypothetical protein
VQLREELLRINAARELIINRLNASEQRLYDFARGACVEMKAQFGAGSDVMRALGLTRGTTRRSSGVAITAQE